MLKRIFRKVVFKYIPELVPIGNRKIAFHWIENVEKNVKKEELTKIYSPYTLIDCEIGKGSYISSNSKVVNTKIGKFCSLGPNLICGWGIHPTNGISTSPYFYSTAKQNGSTIATKNLIDERKAITIGNDVFIGANVTIMDGITIGDGAIIGAGAVVSKDIPDYAIAVGCPIRIIKYRFTQEQIIKLKELAWWDFDEPHLENVNKYFFDIDGFIHQNQ